MADIATLGLAVDSSQVTKATTALTGLTAAAKPAAQSATELQKAAAGLTPIIQGAGAATNKHSESIRGQRLVLRGLAADLTLLGPQFGAAANMAAMLYVDNMHLVGGFSGLKSAIGALITPTNLMIGGLVGLAAGSVLAYLSWKNFALALDDVARQAGTTSSAMSQLQAAAGFHGIDSADFTKGVGAFSDQIYQAKQNMGTLVELLRANGVSAAGDFTTLLGKGADLIKNASSDQQRLVLLQQMGLPANMEWVRFMSQGAAGIKQATEEAAKFGGAVNDEMIAKAREFDEAWNKTWTNWGLEARNAVVSASGWIDSLIMKGRQLTSALGVDVGPNLLKAGLGTQLSQATTDSFYKAMPGAATGTAATPGATKDPNAIKKQISDQQAYIQLLGQTASAEQTAHLVDLQVQAAHEAGINITRAQAAALHQLAYENTLGITAIKAQTDSEKVAGDVVGMSAGQTAEYTAKMNALNQARRDGRTLTAADTAAIQANASALGQAAQRADELKFGYDTFSGTMRDFGANLRNGMSAWDSFAKAGVNALGKIADRLMDMASKSLWQAAFPTGGGGLFGSLFGGGGTASAAPLVYAPGNHEGGIAGSEATFMRATHAAHWNDAPRFHTGGITGDEVPIIAKKGEGVFTAGQMKALAPVGQGSAAPSVTVTNHYTFQGVEPGMEARMRAYIDQGDRRSVEQAVQGVSKVSGNTPAYRASLR